MTAHPRFAVHPGYVRSATDGDVHHIPANRLARLYGLAPGTWTVWDDLDPRTFDGKRWEDYVHVFPRADGDYLFPADKPRLPSP
jgi:hypothetical protein